MSDIVYTVITKSKKASAKTKAFFVLLLFSFLIEFLQLELIRGVFEFDDIFNNTLGAVSGYFVYEVTEKLTGKGFTDTIALFLGTVFVEIVI